MAFHLLNQALKSDPKNVDILTDIGSALHVAAAAVVAPLSGLEYAWGNGCHLVVPKSWENKGVYCMLRDEYN
jgi:hypothetical protein